MNKKLMIYRFGIGGAPFARHKDLLSGYSLQSIVAPNGWGFTGKEISEIDCGSVTNMIVDRDFEKNLEQCDAIYVNDEAGYPFTHKNMQEIQLAINLNKEILIPDSLTNTFCKYNIDPASYKVVNQTGCYDPNHKAVEIDIPVIVVCGLGERTQKFDVQLELGKNFVKEGYKVSQLGSKAYSYFFGFEPLPAFLFDPQYGAVDKIKAFNYYVKCKVQEESPDVLIIGIPDAIMPLFDQDVTNVGILPYLICNAVIPDISVMGVYNNNYTDEYFQELKRLTKYRYNCPTEYFHISNTTMEKDLYSIDLIPSYGYKNLADSLEHLMKSTKDYTIFNAFDKNSFASCYKNISNQLVENICMI